MKSVLHKLCDVVLLSAVVTALPVSAGYAAPNDSLFVPEDPLKGRIVFEQKGCLKCHAILGEGAYIGPDLGRRHFRGDFLEFGRVMWNHSPEMTQQMKDMLQPRPTFTIEEIRDLFVYLYYLRHLGEPGNPEAGKRLFKSKGCLNCHGAGKEHDVPPLQALAADASPVALARAMWNHGPAMDRQMRSLGMERPRFEGEEVTHLAAYLNSFNSRPTNQKQLARPGNPRTGREIFDTKGCGRCHSVSGSDVNDPMSLSGVITRHSLTEIAGMMWNHGPGMWKELGTDVEKVMFEPGEMEDVFAFLYLAGITDMSGDKDRGARVFREKSCYICHDKSAGRSFVVDLSGSHRISSQFDMVRSMWNHAPRMENMMHERNIPWPILREGEMNDLYLYILGILER